MAAESDLIGENKHPVSGDDLRRALTALGLQRGDIVLMHVAMTGLGWVIGGVQTVLQSVLGVLGDDGTLVMPAFSSQLSDPGDWTSPPVPPGWVQPIRDHMPLFDAATTPIRGIGRVADALRALPGTGRSTHPRDSFIAHGPAAADILADHPLAFSLGRGSPLGKLHERGAKVLQLGAGFDSCTCFHLAEHDLPGVAPAPELTPIRRERGVTIWEPVLQPQMFEQHFATLGQAFMASGATIASDAQAGMRLFAMRDAVAFARDWLERATAGGHLSS
ncbi:MAG TPA: AAC(3) family N-acetyltransferase [Aliiroseovarius sp.]|nr:AAC(3) family N-acetyltransferase [Aliiroseovarius sp.]